MDKATAIEALRLEKIEINGTVHRLVEFMEGLAYAISVLQADELVSVVHGRWIRNEKGLWYVECSICHKKVYSNRKCDLPFCETDFCPNCGAKMDGGVENASL